VYSLAFACYGIGTVYVLRGDVPRSMAALERGLDLCRSWNLPLVLPLFGTSLGHAYCLAGRADEAINLLEEAERRAGAMLRIGGHAMLLVRLGEAYLQVLRIGDASRCARQAVTLSREHMERGHEAHALRLLGELGVDDPAELDESKAFYDQTIARAEELHMRPLLARCHLGLGQHFLRIGLGTSAASHLNAAAALFQALEMPFWLEQTRALLASLPLPCLRGFHFDRPDLEPARASKTLHLKPNRLEGVAIERAADRDGRDERTAIPPPPLATP